MEEKLNKPLSRLREQVRFYSQQAKSSDEHNGVGVQNCQKPQELAAVLFQRSAALLVIAGRKEIVINNQCYRAGAGELLLVPAGTTVWLGKYPDNNFGNYHGLGLKFDLEVRKRFRQIYGHELELWTMKPKWCARAPDELIESVQQWIQWTRHHTPDAELVRHRQFEFLLLLARAGLAGHLLMAENPSLRQRVSHLIAIDPSRDWRLDEICKTLGLSASSMGRNLRVEETSFREILEEVRLSSGLSLLQETNLPIGRVAEAVGYRSQSRFSERFKRRFEMTPSDLRRTHIAEPGETLAVQG